MTSTRANRGGYALILTMVMAIALASLLAMTLTALQQLQTSNRRTAKRAALKADDVEMTKSGR